MKRALDNAILEDNLDANFFRILNLNSEQQFPNVVGTNDSRLSDPRPPIDGSVTNLKVAPDAGIEQSKLNLDGDMPPTFLGIGRRFTRHPPPTPAQGGLVQPTAQKNQANGYAGLDANGKLLFAAIPPGVALGTITDIQLVMPPEFSVLVSHAHPPPADRVLSVLWAGRSSGTFLGNTSGDSAPPTSEETVFPVDLIPDFDADKISTAFTFLQLPVAQGVGPDHAPGLVPPSVQGAGLLDTALPDDYLARDMNYKSMRQQIFYQPQVPSPSISTTYLGNQQWSVNITSSLGGTNIFYSTQDFTFIPPAPATPFVEALSGTLPLTLVSQIQVTAYAAKVGYNNSQTAAYLLPFGAGRHP